MNPRVLRLIAIAGAILTVLVGIDGIYMMVAHYKPGDVNSYNLSDGATVVVAAVLLLIITIIAFVLSMRAQSTEGQRSDIRSEMEPEVKR